MRRVVYNLWGVARVSVNFADIEARSLLHPSFRELDSG